MEKSGGSFKGWIKDHPIESFFALAIIICYSTLFPAIFLISRDNTAGQIVGYYVGQIGVFSSVLSAVIITKISQPSRVPVPVIKRLSIFIPVWLITTLINVANLRLTAPPQIPLAGLVILSVPAALLPTYVILSAFTGSGSIRNMLSTLVKPKGNIIYYFVALLTFPIITVAGNMISNLMNGRPVLPEITQWGTFTYTLPVTFIAVLFFSGGLNEESGWRGFAQARLQTKYSPLGSSIILWIMLVIWHIPNDLVQYQNGGYFSVRIVLYFFITILFTWTFNRTKGSILAVAIFHASMNSMNPLMGYFPITAAGNIMVISFAIAVVFADRMWQKLPPEHTAVYVEN